MTLMDALILLGLILIIFGCGFFILATIMERHYDRKLWELEQKQKGKIMKKVFVILISLALLSSVAIAPVYAGGDKNQHENGAETAPGPGDDAQGNQVGED